MKLFTSEWWFNMGLVLIGVTMGQIMEFNPVVTFISGIIAISVSAWKESNERHDDPS